MTTPGDSRRFETSALDDTPASSTTLTMLPESEKLTSANWHQWRGTMVSILRMKGLLGYVDGTIPIPLRSRLRPLPPLPIHTTDGSDDGFPNTFEQKGPVDAADIVPDADVKFPQIPPSASLNPFDKLRFSTQAEPPSSSRKAGSLSSLTPFQTWVRGDGAAATHLRVNIKNTTILRLISLRVLRV